MAIKHAHDGKLTQFRNLRSIRDVAQFFDTTTARLAFHLYSKSSETYDVFSIRKASGGQRIIASPPTVIAVLQTKLLRCITAVSIPKAAAHGFTAERSVRTNALQHVRPRLILNLDLLNFFPNFHFGRVRGLFRHRPFLFPEKVATVLAQLCCFKSVLPQGAPTSPIISNLLCRGLDRDLSRLARNHDCRYTRYADDITISTKNSAFHTALVASMPTLENYQPTLGPGLLQILEKHDLRINGKKTRLRCQNERQEVTGLVVNDVVNVPREFVRNVRAILHDCATRGIPAADKRYRASDRKHRFGHTPHVIHHLRGKIDYLQMIKGDANPIFLKYAIALEKIVQTRRHGVKLYGNAITELLDEALWIVVGKDGRGDQITQGTAFALDGFGIVSAKHVFDSPTKEEFEVVSWELIPASRPQQRYNVKNVRKHKNLDLCVIETDGIPTAALTVENEEPKQSARLRVAGFPRWHGAKDQLSIAPCELIQIRKIKAITYLRTSCEVYEGNSGGPIIDVAGRAVGVVLFGRESSIAPNGGLGIRHIHDLTP